MTIAVAKLLTFFILGRDKRHHCRDFLIHLNVGDFREWHRISRRCARVRFLWEGVK